MAPLAVRDYVRRNITEPTPEVELPVELVCQRADRETGKRARTELSASRVELVRWLQGTGWKRETQ